MNKFDINIYKEKKDKRGIYEFSVDGKHITQMSDGNNGYIENIEYSPPHFYEFQNIYDSSGRIKSSSNFFSDVAIGITKEFDENQSVINEVNEDKKFGKIKYNDILKILSDKKYLDLQSGKGWYLENGNHAINIVFDEQTKIWKISITSGKLGKGGKTGTALILDKIFFVDGNTGKITD